jgi:hypothetical protein
MGTFGTPGQLIFHKGAAPEVSDWAALCAREVGSSSNATLAGKTIFENVDLRTESPLWVSGKKSLISEIVGLSMARVYRTQVQV